MIKLLSRVPYNFFYSLDLALSALTFGAKGQTISARLWEATLSPRAYVKYPFYAFRFLVDVVAFTVFGEKNHCKSSYDAWIASKASLGSP